MTAHEKGELYKRTRVDGDIGPRSLCDRKVRLSASTRRVPCARCVVLSFAYEKGQPILTIVTIVRKRVNRDFCYKWLKKIGENMEKLPFLTTATFICLNSWKRLLFFTLIAFLFLMITTNSVQPRSL